MPFRTTLFRAAAVATAGLLALPATPAVAEEPATAELAGLPRVLDAELSAAEEQRLSALVDGTGVQLDAFVVTPDGPEIISFEADSRSDATAATRLLEAQPSVDSASVVVQALPEAGSVYQWGNTRIASARAIAEVDNPLSDVVVAVLDTGVAPHPELAAALVPGQNFTTSPGGLTDTSDRHGHGTHVAGTIGADAGSLVEGVATGVRIMPVKVLSDQGPGSSTWINKGILWAADHGADVINMSLGSLGNSAGVYASSIAYARSKGVTVVAAAGNDNSSAAHYPSGEVGVISVAAVDSNENKATFSNFGPRVDIAAPGVAIESTTNDGGHGSLQGTSMASPHVAGVAGLIKAAAPGLTPDQVAQVLYASAIDLGAAGRDDTFGHGLLNALRAVRAADALENGTTLPPNSPPVAEDDDVTYATNAGPRVIDVLADDTDVDDDILRITSVTQGAHGTVAVQAQQLRYAPTEPGPFTDTFEYAISDSRGGTSSATVRIATGAPDPSNRAPVAGDTPVSFPYNSGRSDWLAWMLASDADGDPIEFVRISRPTLGVAELAGGRLYYTPPENTYGSSLTSFTFTVTDGRGGFATGLFKVTVNSPNTAPSAVRDTLMVRHDAAYADITVTANDSDPEGDSLSVSAVGTATQGTVTKLTSTIVRYTPSGDLPQGGTDTFTYTLRDSRGLSATGTVDVTVEAAPLAGTPGVPAIGTPTASDGAVTVRWSAPTDPGSGPVTGYRIRAYRSGSLVSTTTTGQVTSAVVPLSNGIGHTFTVAAVNAAGPGPQSALSTPVTSGNLPGAPVLGTVSAGNGSATVSWTPPASDGGAPITGYMVRVHRSGVQYGTTFAAASARSHTFAGLANGTAYTFDVVASNAVGYGTPSAMSTPVVPRPPATVPAAPVLGTVTAGDGSLDVTWSDGGNGGSPVTGWTVRIWTSGALLTDVQVAADLTGTTVTGLNNGVSYTVTVAASNAVGPGPDSAHSSAVTPVTPVAPVMVPSAPGIGTPTVFKATARVRWTAPADDGGSPVTGYEVRTYRSGVLVATRTAPAGATTIVLTGLTLGRAHTFAVAAVNAAGTGPQSISTAVTPRIIPGAPAISSVSAARKAVVVKWAAPTSNGGAAITGWVVRTYSGGKVVKSTTVRAAARSVAVTGLSPAKSYTFRVQAKNAVGPGTWSAASKAVRPTR